MRGKDEQAGVAHADQHHEDEALRRVVARRLARCFLLLPVAKGRLVAVVAVGDEDRPGTHQAADLTQYMLVRHLPEATDDAEVIDRLQGQRAPDPAIEDLLHFAVGVRVKSEYRAE